MTDQPPTPDAAAADAREALRAFPPALSQDFEAAVAAVQPLLETDEFEHWLETGLGIARHSLRSWEASAEYFRNSGGMLEQITYDRMRDWCGIGVDLMETSPALAGALFRASPAVLPHLSTAQVADWAAQGKSLYKGTWKSGSLSAQYFDVSPQVLPHLPLSQMRLLVELIDSLASHSYELASACLGMAPGVLSQLDRSDRAPFLEFGGIVAHTAWVDARVYFERGPAALRQVSDEQRPRYLGLAGSVALQVGRLGHPYFIEAAQALSEVDRDLHQGLLELAEQLAQHSGDAAMEFLKSSPRVAQRLSIDDIARWQEFGLGILQNSVDGGEAFFRLESARGEEVMEALSSRVDLDRVSELIRMYCKALTGVDVGVKASEELTAKGVGWVDESSPTTEGTTIYLPEMVERYQSKDDNFSVYKVFATHQAGRLEFGSFEYQRDRPAPPLRRPGAGQRRQRRRSRRARPDRSTRNRNPHRHGALLRPIRRPPPRPRPLHHRRRHPHRHHRQARVRRRPPRLQPSPTGRRRPPPPGRRHARPPGDGRKSAPRQPRRRRPHPLARPARRTAPLPPAHSQPHPP